MRAVALAQEDRLREAERLARDAVALAERTDYLNDHAGALEDLARILDNRSDRATVAFQKDHWQISYGKDKVGVLPQYPNFPDLMKLVSGWA